MYKFNNAFLEDVGLSSMPEAQKASFFGVCARSVRDSNWRKDERRS